MLSNPFLNQKGQKTIKNTGWAKNQKTTKNPPVVPNELQKELQNDFKRLQIKLGPANRRDFNEISSVSRTWLDLEPFEALLKPF